MRRINKTAPENVKVRNRLRKKKKTPTLWEWHSPLPLSSEDHLNLSHCFVFLTCFGVFRSVAEWSQWFQSFFSSYMRTISHLTNSYTLPSCLRLIPQFYFSIFHCYFDLFLLESYFAPCFLLLSPISSLAYFLPLIKIFNSWTFLRLMSELAHFHIITLASWNEL